MTKKTGLALEGGGSRGSFHVGAVQALIDNGYEFSSVVGTSIGSLNGAMIAQGDFDKLKSLWKDINPATLIDIENEHIHKLANRKIDKKTLTYISQKTKEVIDNKGLDTAKLRAFINENIDEERLRNSPVDFGLVTVSVSDRQAVEIRKNAIPKGKINDYLMASSNLPVFKQERLVDDKRYLDGGVYNNCPVKLLLEGGCNEIIEIRTNASGIVQKYDETGLSIYRIFPSEDLGFILDFTPELMERNVKMGYYDTLRVIRGYAGKRYCLKCDKAELEQQIFKINKMKMQEINTLIGSTGNTERAFFEKTIPSLAKYLKLGENASYIDILVVILEGMAQRRDINRFAVYDFRKLQEFCLSKARNPEVRKSNKSLNIFNKEQKFKDAVLILMREI